MVFSVAQGLGQGLAVGPCLGRKNKLMKKGAKAGPRGEEKETFWGAVGPSMAQERGIGRRELGMAVKGPCQELRRKFQPCVTCMAPKHAWGKRWMSGAGGSYIKPP